MFIKHPTFSKANLFFLLSALTLCTASAVCQQDGDQPQFQRHILSSESLEISQLLKQAQDDDRIAQFNVASRYLQGVRVPQDYKNAAMWYERAAEQGLAAAEFMMGFLCEHGKGVRRDYTLHGHNTRVSDNAGEWLTEYLRRRDSDRQRKDALRVGSWKSKTGWSISTAILT